MTLSEGLCTVLGVCVSAGSPGLQHTLIVLLPESLLERLGKLMAEPHPETSRWPVAQPGQAPWWGLGYSRR